MAKHPEKLPTAVANTWRKRLQVAALALTMTGSAFVQPALAAKPAPTPDEGMWLPMFISRLNHGDMQKKGLKLSAEELYSINNSSIKDAIVSFGGFCTGEIISSQGLILTNHHCGYESIQQHSSVANDYLKDGFWAKDFKAEKPNKDLFVTFLVRMEDVTQEVMANINAGMTEEQRLAEINKAMTAIQRRVEKEEQPNGYRAVVRSFFDNNQFFLFVNQVFEDVRLVGAPPESIGKYGGDTDNWMWPRHTGDFSLFRVYSDPQGRPAKYSESNIPLRPKKYLPVSLGGVREGDFSMIFGYPGRTNRYLSSWGVQLDLDVSHPVRISIRERKLGIMKKRMDQQQAIRIAYAARYAQISNYWKYFIGQSQGLKRLKVVEKKQAEERAFAAWVAQDASRKAEYGTSLADLEKGYADQRKIQAFQMVYNEWRQGPQVYIPGLFANQLAGMVDTTKADRLKMMRERMTGRLAEVYKTFDPEVEQNLLALHMKAITEFVPEDQWPAFAKVLKDKYKGDADKFAAELFKKSQVVSLEKVTALLNQSKGAKIKADPIVMLVSELDAAYAKVAAGAAQVQAGLARANRLYVAGTMSMMPNRKFYPNANSTMRMTYGQVLAYEPKDGVKYNHLTTLDGVMEKEDPNNDEFVVPARLKELYKSKDYGRYAENGKLPLSFISNNDITGGNSGSPVINAHGHLIGTAYDGNWEAMSGDIAFEPELQRTISVDIRYTLFIIEKFAGAKHLVDEMTLVERVPEIKAPEPSIELPATMKLPANMDAAPGTKPAVKPGAKPASKTKAKGKK